MMKRTFMRVLLLSGFIATASMPAKADGFAILSVTQEGQQTDYSISNVSSVTFDSMNMYLNLTNGQRETFPFDLLPTLTIGKDPASIVIAGKELTGMEIKDGRLTINLATDATITLYDASGKLMHSVKGKAGQNGIALGTLPKGTYIVKVNGDSKKLIHQ